MNGPVKPMAGAAAALAGFDYQLEVSVFAALRILLFTKSAGQVELEPDDEEDLGADIEPSSTRDVTQTADLATGQRLVIQVKLASGDPWTLEEFDALLRQHMGHPKMYCRAIGRGA